MANAPQKVYIPAQAVFRNQLPGRAKQSLRLAVGNLKDGFFYVSLLALLVKFILFMGLINNGNATSINLIKAFFSYGYPPPLLVYASFIVLILSFAFLLKGRWRVWFFILLNLGISLLMVGDLLYYRGFGSFLSLYLLKESANLNGTSSSILSMLRLVDFIFVLDVIVMVVAVMRRRKLHSQTNSSLFLTGVLVLLSIGYIWYQHYRVDIVDQGVHSILFRECWTPTQTMTDLSPIGYHIYETYVYWKDNRTLKLDGQEKEEISHRFAHDTENLPANKYFGLFKGQNLIFIQVESLENFVINQQINHQEVTPNLNRLLRNSLYFSNFYEQINNGTSSDADLMSNTSVYPVRTGSTFFRFPHNTYNSLPKLMGQAGYATMAVHPDPGSFWNWMPALKAIGFQRTYDVTHFNVDERIGLGISDRSFLQQVEPMIRTEKQPFYTFMVTLSSHAPFDLPQKYRTLELDKSLEETKLGGYFQSIHYTDAQIGMFLTELDKDGILNNTTVVIYGDHTAIHKYYDDEVKHVTPSQQWWLDDSKRVPLIIYHKGMAGQEIKTIGGQIDTMPTVLYLMGVEPSKFVYTAMGRILVNTKKDFVVLADGTFVGKAADQQERNEAIQGLNISNMIVESNYYETMGYK